MQFWALIIDSLRESRSRKIFWLLVGLTGAITLMMLSIGFGPQRVSFVFGLWEAQTDYYDPLSVLGRSRIAGLVIYLIMDVFLGWIGVALMIVATAGMFPNMMERGQIDVLLAKPLSRPKLFVYKYLAGMVFVLTQATFFVGATFLVMWLRWGIWAPGYLLSIPLLALLFSYLYCVSVLVAVSTRSTVAAVLVCLGAWILFVTPKTALDTFESFPELQKHERAYRTVRVCTWFPPKTWDIPYLAAKWAHAGLSMDMFPASTMEGAPGADPEQFRQARQWEAQQLEVNPLHSIGSSLLFEVVIVLLAMWRFCRQDF